MKKEEKISYQEQKIAFKGIMDGLLESGRRDNEKENGQIISEIEKFAEDPEMFHLMVMYPLDQCVDQMIANKLKVYTRDGVSNIAFIYMQHQFVETNLTAMCSKLEGSACSADKGRHLIRQLIRHFATGTNINVRRTKKSYWIPSCYTGKQWISLFDALVSMYYGNPVKYLKFMTIDFRKAADKVRSKS